MNQKRVVLWQEKGETLERVWNDTSADVITDGEAHWTKAFHQTYQTVRRSLFAKLTGRSADNAISGPSGKDVVPTGQVQHGYLFWSALSGTFEEEMKKRNIPASNAIKLGPALIFIHDAVPQREYLEIGKEYSLDKATYMTVQEVRYTYDRGLNFVLGQVADSPKPNDSRGIQWLQELKRFKQQRVKWATLDGDAFVAMESGMKDDAWLVAMPAFGEIFERKGNTLQVSTTNDINHLLIRPAAITPEWAGIAGVHELEHLENITTGKEPKHPNRQQYLEGEVRAYTVEMEAAHILSKGTFYPALRQIVAHLRISSLENILSMADIKNMEVSSAIARQLDQCITSQTPLSKEEAGIRVGFYMFALAFTFVETEGMSDLERMESRKRIVEMIYSAGGLLPKE